MTSDRASSMLSSTIPTLVGMHVVSRVADRVTGGRRRPVSARNTRRPSTANRTGRPSGGSKSGVGGGFVPAIHYPATKTLTLCGRKLKDTKHTRIRKNVDCKKCKKILRNMAMRI